MHLNGFEIRLQKERGLLTLINARSVRNKTIEVYGCVTDNDLDILAITKTWLKKSGDEAIIAELTPPGFVLKHAARARGWGGGVAILHCDHYTTNICTKQFSTFELIRISFLDTKSIKFKAWVSTIHRRPPKLRELLLTDMLNSKTCFTMRRYRPLRQWSSVISISITMTGNNMNLFACCFDRLI